MKDLDLLIYFNYEMTTKVEGNDIVFILYLSKYKMQRTLPSTFVKACHKGQLEKAQEIHGPVQYKDFHFGEGFAAALQQHQFKVTECLLTIIPDLDPDCILLKEDRMEDHEQTVTLEAILASKQFPPPMTISIAQAVTSLFSEKDQIAMNWIYSHIDQESNNGKLALNLINLSIMRKTQYDSGADNPPESYENKSSEQYENDPIEYYDVAINIHELLTQYPKYSILKSCFPESHRFSFDIIETKCSEIEWPETLHPQEYMREAIIEMLCEEFIQKYLVNETKLPDRSCQLCLDGIYTCICKPQREDIHECVAEKVKAYICGSWCCDKCAKCHDEKVECSGCNVMMCECKIFLFSYKGMLCCYCGNEGLTLE